MELKALNVKDSYQFTKGTFYIMSVLMFLPHYFLLTSTDFWMYKFKPPRPRPPPPFPHGDDDDVLGRVATSTTTEYPEKPEDRNRYQSNITAAISASYAITTTVSLVVLILFKHRLAPPQKRIKVSLVSTFVLFAMSTLFVIMTNNKDRQDLSFFGILLLATMMNLSAAVTIVSLYELVTRFPISYYTAISSGETLCGVISALVQIVIISLGVNSLVSGAIFYGLGSMLLLATIAVYWVIEKNSKYFIYRVGQNEASPNEETARRLWPSKETIKKILRKFKWIYATFVIAYGTSAIMCPGFVALITSRNNRTPSNGPWEQVFFVPVITFLGRQVLSFAGREAAKVVKIPKNWTYIMAAAVLRIGFVPLLLFCNAQPRDHLPVVFGDDAYIIIIFIFGFTEGLLVNLSFLAIPTVANDDEVELAVVLIPLLEFLTVSIFGSLGFIFISVI